MKLNVRNIDEKKIKKLKLVKHGDCGHFGKVYRLNELECIKIFYDKLSGYKINKYNEQTHFLFETARMPKYLVKTNNEINGYVTDFIDGERLSDCWDYDFSSFLKLYSEFIKKACLEISDSKYMIVDGSPYNMILHSKNNCIKLIDTDLWERREKLSTKELIDKNFNELNGSIFNRFLFLLNYDIFSLTIDDDYIDFYESIKQKIEQKNNVKIKTIGDLTRWK